MKIIVNDNWLNTCGKSNLSGVALEAVLVERASWSAMGACYDVTLPDGSKWMVFHSRGVTVVGG